MKRVGMTNDGEMLVSLTLEEYDTLLILAKVSDGQNVSMGHLPDQVTSYSYDLTQPLQAVMAYTRTLSLLNELELEVSSIKAAMMRQQEKGGD